MSDPLTALMHAVQVMNLLKTLIMKTLREREEAIMDEYSPMSSRSAGRESDEEYDSQQEMDASCESRGPGSDCDKHTGYTRNVEYEHENEAVPLSEIEECFLRRLNQNLGATNGGKAQVTFCDGGKTWSWRLNDMHDDAAEGKMFDSMSVSKRQESVKDVKMDQLGKTASSLHLLVST